MTSMQLSIGLVTISWILGFLSYYLISNISQTEKKIQLQELVSQFINFILFMVVGKVVLNFSIFIKNPLVILSYPSNSSALYIAVLLTTITIAYKEKRNHIDVLRLLDAFVHVFLFSSFVYEFIQIIFNNNTYSVGYFILLAVLMMIFLFIRDRVATDTAIVIMVVSWGVGILGLASIMPLIMVFGYTIEPLFLVLFILICIALYILKQRKKVM
ncbi:hypothetical protein EP18_10955 [Lysinibacillus sphaericus]|nr:hypothetical protein [Lysinibacillus sphaericus]KEK11669.1 hypothetical protein EP18_10955 [Lysinibacillus sphaericus]